MDYSTNYRRGCQELLIYIYRETHTPLQGPLFPSLPMLFPQLLCSLHTLVVSSLQTTSPRPEGTVSGASMETLGKDPQFLQRFTRTIWSAQCYGIATYSPANPPESPLRRALKQFSRERHVMRGAGRADGGGTVDWTGCGGDVPAAWKTTKAWDDTLRTTVAQNNREKQKSLFWFIKNQIISLRNGTSWEAFNNI